MSPIFDLVQTPTAHEFPILVQYIEKLGAPIIAVLALAITFIFTRRQWRTAHEQWKLAQQRFVMELSEERLRISNQLQAVIQPVNASGQTTQEDLDEFFRAKVSVSRYFGPEVQQYVEKLFRAMIMHRETCVMLPETPIGEERNQLVRRQGELFEQITGFYREFPKLTADYIQMHAKVPR